MSALFLLWLSRRPRLVQKNCPFLHRAVWLACIFDLKERPKGTGKQQEGVKGTRDRRKEEMD
jgi:hypothetical protein